MLDKMMTTPELFGIQRTTCEENNIGIQVCEDLIDQGELRKDLIQILKIDNYYYSKQMHNPPPSIDCLIVIKTGENQFGLTLVELKNVSSAKDLHPKKIRPKFETTIEDFLSKRFSQIFLYPDYEITYFRLWLVTNPYNYPPMSKEQYLKKLKGTVLELYLSDKPYRFRSKVATIEHKPPSEEICI